MRKEERGEYKFFVTLSDQNTNFLPFPTIPLTPSVFGLLGPTSVFLSLPHWKLTLWHTPLEQVG